MNKSSIQPEGNNGRRDLQYDDDANIEDLYKSDADRRLWAPAPYNEEFGSIRRMLRRWSRAVRSALRRIFSSR